MSKYLALYINRCLGFLLLGLGVWVVVSPGIFASRYGIMLDSSASRSVIRAVIGGAEIALAMFFLLPKLFGAAERTLLRFGATVFASIFIVRIIHLLLDQSVAFSLMRETAIEGFIAANLWVVVYLEKDH